MTSIPEVPQMARLKDSTHCGDLGERMKGYEGAEAGRRFMPLLPIVARIDGRCFHSFTRDMSRPFDAGFSRLMLDTARYLARETNACMAYTQSDEITLTWHSTDPKSQVWFDGRIHKMVSQLAAHGTLVFYRRALDLMPERASRLPTFDGRAWQVPNRTEGANVFVWREWDATKNSITMAAQMVYSDNQLHGINGAKKQEMLWQSGINWNDYPAHFKRGTYIQRRIVARPFTTDEIDKLPERHDARTNPGLVVDRAEWQILDMPPIQTVVNREAVIYDGAEPERASSDPKGADEHLAAPDSPKPSSETQ